LILSAISTRARWIRRRGIFLDVMCRIPCEAAGAATETTQTNATFSTSLRAIRQRRPVVGFVGQQPYAVQVQVSFDSCEQRRALRRASVCCETPSRRRVDDARKILVVRIQRALVEMADKIKRAAAFGERNAGREVEVKDRLRARAKHRGLGRPPAESPGYTSAGRPAAHRGDQASQRRTAAIRSRKPSP